MRFVLNLRGTHEMQIMKASLGTGFLYEIRVEEVLKDGTVVQEFSIEASLHRLHEFFALGTEMVNAADQEIKGWEMVRRLGSGKNLPELDTAPSDEDPPLSEDDLRLPTAYPDPPLMDDDLPTKPGRE